MPGNLGAEEGLGYSGCGDVVDGRSLGPTGEAVSYAQDEGVALIRCQGSNGVWADMMEPVTWNGENLKGDLVCLWTLLIWDASAASLSDVPVDGRPHGFTVDEMLCGLMPWCSW